MAALTLTALLQGLGAIVTGAATFAAASNNAAIQEMNAEIADDNAKRALERAAIEQQESDFRTRGLLGEQLAQQAASGVDIGSGSPKYTRIAARELGRLDALNIRQAGELEAYNYRTQSVNFRANAAGARAEGAFGLLGGFLNAGSALTNATPVAKKNYFAPNPTPRQTSLLR